MEYQIPKSKCNLCDSEFTRQGMTRHIKACLAKHLTATMGPWKKTKKLQVLSRNAQPITPCDECSERPAVQICVECQWDEMGWLCEKCAQTHECGEDMFLPVVNSQRTGSWGYTGD